MRELRAGPVVALVAIAVLTVPILPARADTVGKVVFADGKVVVQCPNPVTGLGMPGSGINKGKKCSFVLNSKNPHKNDLHTCNANAFSNAAKKGSSKPPVVQGATFGKAINNCEFMVTGTLGPKVVPDGGPWCGEFQGVAGSGSLKIGPKAAPLKVINFDRVRMHIESPRVP